MAYLTYFANSETPAGADSMGSINLFVCAALVMLTSVATAADKDQSPSDKIISDAIVAMEKKRDELNDPLEKSRVDKAIRELQDILDDSNPDPQKDTDINIDLLKKKLAGRVVIESKTGELTLRYDFSSKAQLADFDVGKKRVLITKKNLAGRSR